MEVVKGEKVKVLATNKIIYEGELLNVGSNGITIKIKEKEKTIELFFPWNSIIWVMKENKDIEVID